MCVCVQVCASVCKGCMYASLNGQKIMYPTVWFMSLSQSPECTATLGGVPLLRLLARSPVAGEAEAVCVHYQEQERTEMGLVYSPNAAEGTNSTYLPCLA